MKLLLMLLSTLITFSSQAQIISDKPESDLTMTCMLVILLITLLIGAVVYLSVKNNKRSINDNSNTGKNT